MHSVTTPTSARKTVLVLGGRGFIGSHAVDQLRLNGARVLIGTRRQARAIASDEYRYLPLHRCQTSAAWEVALAEVDVVINAVGILRERLFESYESVHHRAVRALANACAQAGIRLVHVSILGVDSPARSRLVSSRARGEQALRESSADWIIVRPSLVDGEGGNGAKWFRRVARWPIHFAPANALGGFAPIAADDLGEALARLALGPAPACPASERIVELSGPQILTVFEYLTLLDPYRRAVLRIAVPAWLSRLVSHVCDLIYATPFSFGHYELLKYRNYPRHNQLPSLLGRAPRAIGDSAPKADAHHSPRQLRESGERS